jgi:enolase
MADKIIGFAVKGVAAGIGLASEGIHYHKEKRREKKLAESGGSAKENSNSSATLPNIREPGDEAPREEGDEEQWQLDEAQDEIVSQISQDQEKKKSTRSLIVIVEDFVGKYPLPSDGGYV